MAKFCARCRGQADDTAKLCYFCAAPFDPIQADDNSSSQTVYDPQRSGVMTPQKLSTVAKLLIISVSLVSCIFFLMVALAAVGALRHPTHPDTASIGSNPASANPAPAPPDPEKEAQSRAETQEKANLDKTQEKVRQEAVNKLNSNWQYLGVDFVASIYGRKFSIFTDTLKSQYERDQFISTTFTASFKQDLCALGFKTFEVRGTGLFDSGTEYKLPCKETPQERQKELDDQLKQRQDFAKALEESANSEKALGTTDATVEVSGAELVMTSPGFSENKDGLQVLSARQFTGRTLSNLCGMGFRGTRWRKSKTGSGVYLSLNCPKA